MEKDGGQQVKAPKVHQSCDLCQISKIRCGKERPACRRCVKHNLSCVYSISRRTGRPRSNRTGSATPSKANTLATTQCPPVDQRQIAPPTPTSPVPEDCTKPGPAPGLLLPKPAIVPATCASNMTDVTIFPNEEQPLHDYRNSSLYPGVQQQNQILGTYSEAAPDLISASFPVMSFFDDTTGTLRCDNSALTSMSMLGPSETRTDAGISHFLNFEYYGSSSGSPWTNLNTATSSQSGEISVDSSTMFRACLCSTLLILQLTESPTSPNNIKAADSMLHSSWYPIPLQWSTALIDQCFNILNCTQCGPKPSSALLVCQAMDKLSIVLGIGTIWGNSLCDNLSRCIDSAVEDQFLVQLGTYVVRKTDRRALLKTLLLQRLAKMERVMLMLSTIVQREDAEISLHQEAYAGLITELISKVASIVEQIKSSA